MERAVTAALERAGLPTSGPVGLFHATNSGAADLIAETGLMKGDSSGQAWLASSKEIAALGHAGGATGDAESREPEIDALLEVEVEAERLYWEETRSGEEGEIELFYLLDGGGGCPVDVRTNGPWSPSPPAPPPGS
jgi:hypothetical protein